MIRVFASGVQQQLRESRRDPCWLGFVPGGRQQQIQRLRRIADRERALAGEFLSRRVLADLTGMSPGQIRIERDGLQKPRLEGVDLYFNLAHSVDRLALAVSDTPVGIDVERIRPMPELAEISTRFLSATEHQQLSRSPEPSRLALFFEYWTLKESFLKALGDGLSVDLRSFSVIRHSEDRIRIEGETVNPGSGCWQLRTYRLEGAYRVAVCVDRQEPPGLLEWIGESP